MTLADLKTIHKALKERILREAEQARLVAEAALQAKRRATSEHDLFLKAIGKVAPLAKSGSGSASAALGRTRPAPLPLPLQKEKDDMAALEESLSDEMDIESLLETDESLSYRQTGIGVDVIRKLRRGVWAIQGELDLHNLRSDEARTALSNYIRLATVRGWRCIRVIHGKGNGSLGKAPVLKNKVQRWLVQKIEVLAFVQAKAADGGRGALVVLLA
jgi:DNA-nicking Smr family endonuclease